MSDDSRKLIQCLPTQNRLNSSEKRRASLPSASSRRLFSSSLRIRFIGQVDSALRRDDQCAGSGECGLSAVQLRGVKGEDWGLEHWGLELGGSLRRFRLFFFGFVFLF